MPGRAQLRAGPGRVRKQLDKEREKRPRLDFTKAALPSPTLQDLMCSVGCLSGLFKLPE